jgi:hypothetical protein
MKAVRTRTADVVHLSVDSHSLIFVFNGKHAVPKFWARIDSTARPSSLKRCHMLSRDNEFIRNPAIIVTLLLNGGLVRQILIVSQSCVPCFVQVAVLRPAR